MGRLEFGGNDTDLLEDAASDSMEPVNACQQFEAPLKDASGRYDGEPTPEEWARLAAYDGPTYTTAEVLAHLRSIK